MGSSIRSHISITGTSRSTITWRSSGELTVPTKTRAAGRSGCTAFTCSAFSVSSESTCVTIRWKPFASITSAQPRITALVCGLAMPETNIETMVERPERRLLA